ncbi:hypothetical protein LCGC14_2514610 [marine sediment metagenome]|uniref:DUF5675 domain-containing protein n=1 Tax=marine sediment metagenome TaxID=412755 RepID=A0A0F9DRH2_9ZZZZ
MLLQQIRLNGGVNDTIDALYIDGSFVCFALEDDEDEIKVPGQTRIPGGLYQIKLRTEGGMHNDYAEKYPDMHKGMLWIKNIPNFEWVYLHIGNKHQHTAGCPLVGDSISNNSIGDGFVGNSTQAYKRIYPIIADAILRGEKVWISITEIELPDVELPKPKVKAKKS